LGEATSRPSESTTKMQAPPVDDETFAKRSLVFSFLEFLSQQSSSEGSLVVDSEGLEVAQQCLGEAFGLDINNQEQKQQYSIEPLSLLQVFSSALAEKQNKVNVSGIPDELVDKWVAFEQVLTNQGFFKGTENNPAEKNVRLEMAKQGFLKKYSVETEKQDDSAALEEAEKHKGEGNALLSEGKTEEAIVSYSKAIALNSNNAVYYANRAAAHSRLGKHSEAILDCKRAIDVDPSYSKAYSRLGLSLFSLGKYQEAIDLGYKKCLELDPNNITAQESLSLCQEKLGEQPTQTENQQSPFSGLGSLLSDPNVQSTMQNLAQQMGQGGEQGDGEQAQGMPDLSSLLGGQGGGGGGGMPDLSSLMNNPALMNMASQFMSNPAFSSMMQNPAVMNMAQNLMQNPSAMNEMLSSMGLNNQNQDGENKEE